MTEAESRSRGNGKSLTFFSRFNINFLNLSELQKTKSVKSAIAICIFFIFLKGYTSEQTQNIPGKISEKSKDISRVLFRNNCLYVDDKPFFMYGAYGVRGSKGYFVDLKKKHINAVLMNLSAASGEHGQNAAKAGLMIVVNWNLKWLFQKGKRYSFWSEGFKAGDWEERLAGIMKKASKNDNILVWNIGDDLKTDEELVVARKAYKLFHRLDPQHRPVALDSIKQYEKFAQIPDLWCTYAYPLAKVNSSWSGKPGGFREYYQWLKNKRLLKAPGSFFWTYAQAHTQVWYNDVFCPSDDRKHSPTSFPDGDHIQLLTSYIISSGAKGIMWFKSPYLTKKYMGLDRLYRVADIGCLLDIIGPFIAQGKTAPRLKTGRSDVWATPIDFPGGRLICLIKHNENDHYQAGNGKVENVHIDIDNPGAIYRISDKITKLDSPACSFDLTGWLLLTEDKKLVETLRKRLETVLPDMARFSSGELEERIRKVAPVFSRMKSGKSELSQAREDLKLSKNAISRGEWGKAYKLSRTGLSVLREAQYKTWKAFFSPGGLGYQCGKVDFYMLPSLAENLKSLKTKKFGGELLKNPSFEDVICTGKADEGAEKRNKYERSTAKARTGQYSLHMKSDKVSVDKYGETTGWLTRTFQSEKIKAKTGEIIKASAWIYIPERFRKSDRGVALSLTFYDKDRKTISRYNMQRDIETKSTMPTEGWEKVQIIIPLDKPGIEYVSLRMGLAGKGEAFIDDISLQRLEP